MKKRSIAITLAALALSSVALPAFAELCRAGQNVDVLWKNEWYKARVVTASDSQCKITYTDYSKDYDEWVGPDRLKIKVMWKGDWYPARVVRREGANFLISYDGYGQDDNEIVPVSRIEVR
ncbi:MAG: agenet domain-containing protein [Pseudomonadota bacterium]